MNKQGNLLPMLAKLSVKINVFNILTNINSHISIFMGYLGSLCFDYTKTIFFIFNLNHLNNVHVYI